MKVNPNNKTLKDEAKAVANAGRNGDKEIIHVTKDELPLVHAFLKALGGSGTVNPETGAREYWKESHVDDKSGGGAGGSGGANGNGSGGAGGGNHGGTGGRPGGVGKPGVGGGFDGTGRKNPNGAPAGSGDAKTAQMNSLSNNVKKSSQNPNPSPTDTASQVDAVNQGAVGYKDTQVDKARRQSQADAADEGDTWFERNIVKPGLNALGLGESPLTAEEAKTRVDQSVSSGQPVDDRANWNLDPTRLGATIAGLVGGPIGGAVSLGYTAYDLAGGPTPSIGLGPDVFGGTGFSGSTSTQSPTDQEGKDDKPPMVTQPGPSNADVGTPSDIPAAEDDEENKKSGSFSATSLCFGMQ